MMATSEAVVKVRLDPSELLDAIDELPDAMLDRLADKLTPRIERRMAERAQWRGQGRTSLGL